MLLLALGLQRQSVADNLLSRRDAGQDHLRPGIDAAARHFRSPELVSPRRYEDPVAIVQMQNGRTRKYRVVLAALPEKSCGREHSYAHDARIAEFYSHFGAAQVRI